MTQGITNQLPEEYYQDQHPNADTHEARVDEVESNIRQLRATYLEQRQQETTQQQQPPTLARAPLEIIAAAFQTLTYGTMMQFAQELKSVEGTAFETVEQVAATLHFWALNHGKIDTSVLKPKPTSTEQTQNQEPVKSSADLLPKVEPETPITGVAVTQDMVQPAV